MKRNFLMKNILLLISLITGIMLIGLSCKKSGSKNSLPPATETGANTVGFYVNGKPWLPNVEPFGSIPGLEPVRALFGIPRINCFFFFSGIKILTDKV